MQSGWPGLQDWVMLKVVQSASSGSGPVSSGPRGDSNSGELSSPVVASYDLGKMSLRVPHVNGTSTAGRPAAGGGMALLLQARGILLRLLGGSGSNSSEKKGGAMRRQLERHITLIRRSGPKEVFSGVIRTCERQQCKGQRAASRVAGTVFLKKVSSLLLETIAKFGNQNVLPMVTAAMLPPLTTPQCNNFLPFPRSNDLGADRPCESKNSEVTIPAPNKWLKGRWADDAVIAEPKTGIQFPRQIAAATGDQCSTDQVLFGVGARAISILKLKFIWIYALGLYVQPDQLRERLGEKYMGMSTEELKSRPDFYDELLSQGVDMTMRLIVHRKGLKMGMIRRAFETAIKMRLMKIKGSEEDDGLTGFSSLMSEDSNVFKGTIIDFRWQPAQEAIQAEIGGSRIGTIYGRHFCRAFFEMYVGDPPVSSTAKLDIGESFAHLLTTGTPD